MHMVLYDIHIKGARYTLIAFLSDRGDLSIKNTYAWNLGYIYLDGEEGLQYNFDKVNTENIKVLLGTDDVLTGLADFFKGEREKLIEFFDLCNRNGITKKVLYLPLQ